MTTNTQSLTIGDKYVYTGTDTSVSTQYPLIFIGFNQEQAQFIPDDQVLYDLLGEPFSKKAFNDYANKHDIDDLSKKTNVTCNGEIDAWLSQDAVKTKISALEAELKSAREIMDKYDKKIFYATDCPGGEIHTQFIREFEKSCGKKGLSTFGFSFHGFENENRLSVTHNGNEVESDTYDEPSHFDVYNELKNNPKYARMRISFAYSSNAPELN